jgi:NADPH:quinone reductase-like Zn-dependent oxidoreductase
MSPPESARKTTSTPFKTRAGSIQFGDAAKCAHGRVGTVGLMRAAVLRTPGSPDGFELETWPDPSPGPGEVLLRVGAVCVNRTDVHVIERTNIGRNVPLPHIGGLDPAGEIVALGPDVDGPPVGTRVVARPMIPCLACRFCQGGSESGCERPSYIGIHRPGGFGELVALPARAVFPTPDGMDDVTAAAAAHSVPIAIHLLETVGAVGPRDRVLVVGAAGGLGIAAVQLAKTLGAQVVAVAGDEAKLEVLRGLGADVTLSSADPSDLAERVRAATDGGGVTVAVDNVGSTELWPQVVASLDKGGRILSCGAHAGGQVELDLSLFYRMQLRLLSTAGTTADEFRRGLDLVATGRIRPLVHAVRPLAEVREAFRDLLDRRNIGKIVLRVTE